MWLEAKKALSNIYSRFIYIQIKYALKTLHQLEGEDVQFMCQGLRLIPRPRVQQPWKNFVASLATDKEAPMRKSISVQIYMI